MTRQRVYSSDWRKEAGDELDEPLPAEACRLTAPLERREPEPLHLVEEPPQVRVVTRDNEVVQMPFQHAIHANLKKAIPSGLFRLGSQVSSRQKGELSIVIGIDVAPIVWLMNRIEHHFHENTADGMNGLMAIEPFAHQSLVSARLRRWCLVRFP